MFQIHKKLKSTYKALAFQQTIGAFVLLLDEFVGFLPVYFLGLAIDEFKNNTLTFSSLMSYILKIGSTSLASYVMCVLFVFFIDNSGNYGGYFLRKKFFASLLKKPMSFFEKYKAGDLLSRNSNDIDYITIYFGNGFILLMDSFIYPFVCIAMMATLTSWRLTLATLIPFPIITILYALTSKEIQKRAGNVYSKFGHLSQEILEMAEGIKLVRSLCNEKVRLNKLSKKVKLYFDAVYFKAKLDSLLQPVVTLITEIAVLIAFCYGGVLVYRGEITYGNLISFFMFVYLFTWSCISSSFYIQMYKDGLASAERVLEILNAKEKEERNEKPLKSIETIEFKNFNFKYETSEKNVLNNISFKLNKGEIVAVVGKTGGGKTSLVRALLHIYDTADGILINGEESKLFSSSIRTKIGYVSQREQLFQDTIYNNVTFFNSNYSEAEVKEVLNIACFEDVENFPLGIQTKIGERGLSLSGGQRQRLSIARAIIKHPSLLILDDSLSAVDSKTSYNIVNALKQKKPFDICLMVTHKVSIMQEMDKIIVLNDGFIEEIGTHQELSNSDGWYKNEFLSNKEEAINEK